MIIKEKKPDNNIIETPMLLVELRDNGITYAKPRPDAHSTLEDSKESFRVITEINKGKPALILNDFRDSKTISIDKDARDYTASPEVEKMIRAFAILVRSPASVTFGNLWMMLSKPSYPTRLFNKEEDAVAWLEEFME